MDIFRIIITSICKFNIIKKTNNSVFRREKKKALTQHGPSRVIFYYFVNHKYKYPISESYMQLELQTLPTKSSTLSAYLISPQNLHKIVWSTLLYRAYNDLVGTIQVDNGHRQKISK